MRTACQPRPRRLHGSFWLLTALAATVLLVGRAPARSSGHREDAYGYRQAAEACVARHQYAQAADAYLKAAAIYQQKGDPGAAFALRARAERYESAIALYYERPADETHLRRYYTGRRLEPLYGAYIGAFIDRESGVNDGYMDENFQTHKDCGEFNERIGRDHALFFEYMRYGRPFPSRWTDHLRRYHAAAQLVLSPENLEDVQDDAYLHTLARQAYRSGVPIFLRFAGEMNGDWVPYHGNPALYIKKFRLVARVFHEETDNVALVWCVNDVPEAEIPRYFPGDDAVDWVGVNFYSVLYNNNDRSHPAWWRNPADSLRYVYKTYAGRHPIMIGEWAATHKGRADMVSRPDFAVTKIGQLYSALPRLYPRVKAVSWLSMNNLEYAEPGRQLNDYSLLEDKRITTQYANMVSSPYYLDHVSLDEPAMAGVEVARLEDGVILSGRVVLSAWARSYEENPRVVYGLAGRKMHDSSTPSAHEWVLDTRSLPNGPIILSAQVLDSQGKIACQQTLRVLIRN
ncbi:MAG TPA: glycosyl hydrolase [Chthonomonadaceae bacterium]|nr:glycosyl hydrolase [Chthonomonadaceae bacterium]